MIINANDIGIGAHVEQLGVWAEDDLSLMAQIIRVLLQNRSCIVFYDVGANIGTHSVALSREFGSHICIRAFEAQRLVFYQLCGNLALNNLENVLAYHAAVSDGNHPNITVNVPDYQEKFNYGGLELLPNAINSDNLFVNKPNTEIVNCLRIDDFDEHVDFIKLDIEGMELQALEGARKIISNSRPVCFVEVLKSDIVKIQDFFRKLNYVLYRYKDDDWIFVHKDSDVELDLPKVLL